MSSSRFGHRLVALCIGVASLFVAENVQAQSEPSARARVQAMNDEAMEAYAGLDLARAEAILNEALGLATRDNVTGPELARLFVSLGVIAVAGHSNRARGIDDFVRALEADSSVRLDPMTSTPEVQSAFETARTRFAARGTAPATTGGSTTGGSTSQVAGESGSGEGDPNACTSDASCGEGRRCSDGVCVARTSRPRLFLQLGFTGGVFFARPGMPADDRAPSGGNPDTYAGYVMGGTAGCDEPPAEYCVRVDGSTPVFVLGLRATLGYWLSPRWAIALGVRAGPGGGSDPTSYLMIGSRAQVLLTNPDNSNFDLSLFLGVGFGQTQLRPSQESSNGMSVVRPWIQTGLLSVNIGAVASYRFLDHLGLFGQVGATVFFPNVTYGVEATVGPELAF